MLSSIFAVLLCCCVAYRTRVLNLVSASQKARRIRNGAGASQRDRKSTRLNSSHGYISYAVFCLKKNRHAPDHVRTPMRTLPAIHGADEPDRDRMQAERAPQAIARVAHQIELTRIDRIVSPPSEL